jgi:hypothetical protein
MRYLLPFALTVVVASSAVAFDPESKNAYQLRVAVRTGDHPTLTKHFRAEITRSVTSAMQAALGPVGSVTAIDLNDTPAEKLDALCKLANEKGLDALDGVNAVVGGKTHFVFIDFADGKYEIRTRQHDGTAGFVTPMVRKAIHGDRGFVGRLAGLAVAQDFGVVGTFDATGPQVSVVFKAGELGPLDAWVKKGDVFAAVQVREVRKGAKPAKGKSDAAPTATAAGTRVDGVLLQVIDGPRNGVCVCKLHNRYRSLPSDGGTLGYRCVKLGTGEAPLKLQLTDMTGNPFPGDRLQPRAGTEDFPDATTRQREEMKFTGGVFTSTESFKNIAFVLVKAGEAPIARIPVEIYPDQIAVRRVSVSDKLPSAVEAAAADMFERTLNARVMQLKVFEDMSTLQKKEKPKALAYGNDAYDSLTKEAELLRGDLSRLKDRYGAEATPELIKPSEDNLTSLETKTRELRTHLAKLKEVITLENNPAAATALGLVNEASFAVKNYDIDVAIGKYEEALKLPGLDPDVANEVKMLLDKLKADWEPKDADHTAARKFIYDVWAKLENPPDVKAALPEARKALAKCKAIGDKIALNKMYHTTPQVFQRYHDSLKKIVDEASGDPDKIAELTATYGKVNEELKIIAADVAKEVVGDGK